MCGSVVRKLGSVLGLAWLRQGGFCSSYDRVEALRAVFAVDRLAGARGLEACARWKLGQYLLPVRNRGTDLEAGEAPGPPAARTAESRGTYAK